MSREAFSQLPAESQTHLEGMPDDIQDSAHNQLLSVSHQELHRSDSFGFGETDPIPQSELDEEHQPYIDTVAKYMERTSLLLSTAHAEMVGDQQPDQEVSFDALAIKAKEVAFRSAQEAKEADDSGAATQALETLLIVEAFDTPSSADTQHAEDTKHFKKQMVRSAVENGLADELVQAAHDTHGLVTVHEREPAPVNATAQTGHDLLCATTTFEIDDDFSDVIQGSERGSTEDLEPGDLLALANAAENGYDTTRESTELVETALTMLASVETTTEDFMAVMDKAGERGLDGDVAALLPRLRANRVPGARNRYSPEVGRLDRTVVQLAHRGKPDAAKGLMSSAPSEVRNLEFHIDQESGNEEESAELTNQLQELHIQKQNELRQHLHDAGVSEETASWVIESTIDPDSAIGIQLDFWHKIEADSSLKEMLANAEDLSRTAEIVTRIDQLDLTPYRDTLFPKIRDVEDEATLTQYLRSFHTALERLSADQQKDDRFTEALSRFRDPAFALESVQGLYGSDNLLEHAQSLHDLVGARGNTQELARFRTEDMSAFALLRDEGIPFDQLKIASRMIMGQEDPISRAQEIIKGVEAADVEVADNPVLFRELANHESPAALGRALNVLEHQFSSVTAGIYEDFLDRTIKSSDPEHRVSLYARTQEVLQDNHLSVENIGTDVFSVARMIEDGQSQRDIERYCSNWKIRQQCRETFGEYWRYVREHFNTPLHRRESGDIIEQKPTLDDLPEIRARFETLGITSERAKAMFDSWSSFYGLGQQLYKQDKTQGDATDQNIEYGLKEQESHFEQEINALTDYVERFGIEETESLMETFGIHDFKRYKPEQLHEQVRAWNDSQVYPKNVVVFARYDWNNANANEGETDDRILGRDGLFCFEVNDRTELARTAVAVGDRERAFGRTPDQENTVENFILNAHASPESIVLGTKKESISVGDYVDTSLNGFRANTYQRHLGSQFRVILKACSTAAEVAHGKNIAQAISDQHEVSVTGSKVNTKGSIVIENDGTVKFNQGEILGTVYE